MSRKNKRTKSEYDRVVYNTREFLREQGYLRPRVNLFQETETALQWKKSR